MQLIPAEHARVHGHPPLMAGNPHRVDRDGAKTFWVNGLARPCQSRIPTSSPASPLQMPALLTPRQQAHYIQVGSAQLLDGLMHSEDKGQWNSVKFLTPSQVKLSYCPSLC